ncbi:MAG TPA: universal stress protein [Sphingobium sp.]|nr:universal stress protein [Sphingobium sp.]
MSIRTIVAALALETDDDPVAARALQLARQHGAKLVFIHVIENGFGQAESLPAPADAATLQAAVEQAAGARIRAMIGEARPQEAVIILEAGKPYEVIDHLARREQADLLLIGPGKARNVRERVFGSTADRLVRIADRPVLVVRAGGAASYAHISVAMDFSASSRAAFEVAAGLAGDAAMELVHMVEIPLTFEQAMLKAGTPQLEIRRYRRDKANAVRQKLADFVAESRDFSVEPGLRVVQGEASAALVRLSRSGRTDLLALGLHSRTMMARALLGSVARHVLQGAACDVLVVGARAGA